MKIKTNNILLLLLILVLLAVLLTACQPTPTEEIVVQRDNTEKEVLESAQEESNEEEEIVFEYTTPEHVEERFTVFEDTMDVVIDADVIMPDIDNIPVAKVTQDLFTQERADELRAFFMTDGELVSDFVMTKADYDEMIIEARRGHEVDGEMVYDEGSEQWVQQLLEEREKAPDTDTPTVITDYSISKEDGLHGRVRVDGEITGYLSIQEDMFLWSTDSFYRSSTRVSYNEETGEEIQMPQKDIDFTLEEAIEIAQNLFSQLGIEDMQIAESDKVYFLEDDYYGDIKYGGYYITFMREFGGLLPISINGWSMGPDDNFDVSPPVRSESIDICIDEYGTITQFYWRNPVKIVEIMTEHVDILPFEDILDRLRQSAKLQYSYMSEYSSEVLMIKDIYEIRLGLNYLPIKNNSTEFMYAPCWYFIYKDWQEYTEEQEEEMAEWGYYPHWDEMSDEYFIFSAVDGATVSSYTSEDYEEMMRWEEEYEE